MELYGSWRGRSTETEPGAAGLSGCGLWAAAGHSGGVGALALGPAVGVEGGAAVEGLAGGGGVGGKAGGGVVVR